MGTSTLYQLIWQTRRLFQRLRSTSDELLDGTGVNASQRAVLEFLHQQQPQTVPQIDLGKSVSRQHIQTVVNDLLIHELIETVENPTHKRSPLIQLTSTGTRLFNTIQKKESRGFSEKRFVSYCHDINQTFKHKLIERLS